MPEELSDMTPAVLDLAAVPDSMLESSTTPVLSTLTSHATRFGFHVSWFTTRVQIDRETSLSKQAGPGGPLDGTLADARAIDREMPSF
jgi:hypothetical protein